MYESGFNYIDPATLSNQTLDFVMATPGTQPARVESGSNVPLFLAVAIIVLLLAGD